MQLTICYSQLIPQRPYPTKTRIKTCIGQVFVGNTVRLRDHIPPKQGLRHLCVLDCFGSPIVISETISHQNKD